MKSINQLTNNLKSSQIASANIQTFFIIRKFIVKNFLFLTQKFTFYRQSLSYRPRNVSSFQFQANPHAFVQA